MVNFFSLTLNPQQAAVAVTVSEAAELPQALAQLGLSDSRPVLVIVGGASKISEADFLRIQRLFVEVLAPIAQRLGAYVVDGGTDAGVMQLIGKAHSQINADFPLIGVAPTAKVILPKQTTVLSEDATPLEAHHTHFVLVPGCNWGDESPWIVQIATLLANGAPSITVLINGGEITFIDALNSVIAGRLVMVIAGSGRTADKLASALHGDVTDERAKQLAESGCLQTIDLEAAKEDLINTITNLLLT
jgi:SLOG in TRPM, prokaryote